MAYYNINCKKLKFDNLKYLNSGMCAKVLNNDNLTLKLYFENTFNNSRIDPKIFNFLKTIKNDNFIELYEIITNFTKLELFLYKLNKIPFIVDGYTSKYYK